MTQAGGEAVPPATARGAAEAAAAGPAWVENSSSGGPGLPWRELWAGRELVLFFAARDLRVRYKQAALGVGWVLLQPLIAVAAFTLVFDRIAEVDSQGLPYPVLALSGLLGWTYLSQCISRGSEVLVANSALVTKVYIPRLLAPLAALLPPLLDLAVGLLLLLLFCVALGVAPGPEILLLPVWALLLLVTALGPVCLLAALNVRFRDVRQAVGPLLQALLFVSPVAYSSAALDGVARYVYALNPAAGAIDLGRYVLVGTPWPGLPLLVSALSATVLAVLGVLYFQRAQHTFADVI